MSLLALFDEFGQIVEPTPLDASNPMNRGLMLAFDGGVTRTFDPVTGALNTVNGTRLQASQDDDGLATGFGTTYGVASTDRIDSTLTTDSTLITVQARVFLSAFTNSRIVDKGVNGFAWGGNNAGGVLVSRPYSGGQSPLYDYTMALNGWVDTQVTWDSSGSAIPIPYVNSDLVSTTITTPPT